MAVRIDITPATFDDAAEMAVSMRAADAAECFAMTAEPLLPMLLDGLRRGAESWAVRFDGVLACMWGVVSIGDGAFGRHGRGWLLCTDVVERRPVTFVRACNMIVPWLLGRWDSLSNAIDARHTQAVRWARRLGFRLHPPEPVGPAGLPFHRFTVALEDVRCAHPRQ